MAVNYAFPMLNHQNFRQVYDQSAGSVIALDGQGVIVYANPAAVRDLFMDLDYAGRPARDFFSGPDKEVLQEEEFTLEKEGEPVFVLVSSANFTDTNGLTLTYWMIRDISALKKKEYLLAYLNTATEELSRARDTKGALAKISQLIVPKFATWFSIDLIHDGRLEELVLAHEDPGMIRWARTYREAYPTDLKSDSGAARVVKTGEPSFVPQVTEAMVRGSIKDPDQLEAILRLNLQSVITVAIYHKETITGLISFVSSVTGQYYDEADLRFAQNLANHIGLALENARLNEQLEHTRVQLESALSSGLVGTWTYDMENDRFYPDQNLARMFGMPYEPGGCSRAAYMDLLHPDDAPLINAQRQHPVVQGGQYETEYRVIVNGAVRWFFARGQTRPGADGHLPVFTGVIVDVTERKAAELALKESGELFRFLADAIPHKIWTANPQGQATYYNQGWYEYTGIRDFEELREKVWDILHPDDRPVAEAEWPKAMASGQGMQMESRFRRHDGTYRWHLSRFSAHRDAEGHIQLWVGTSTDIHEQKENEQRKDEFLSIASHELKTPLTSIKAFNQLMKRTRDEARLAGFIDKSADHIYRLERLINDLLDVTKINAGKVVYTAETFVFSALLRESIDNMQYNASHEIILESAADVPFTGDRLRLERVINNFLTNAAKYSPDGSRILVNNFVEGDSLVVSVQDFGIGIAPENLDKLFDRYYRVDNTAMRFDGLGLGLFISAEILRRHQGSFWIESEPGKGSTFYFRLPLPADNTPVIQKSTAYLDSKITINCLPAEHTLEVDWSGFQDLASVQRGCLLMLDYLSRNHCDRVVNDNTHVQGNWSEAVEWVGNEWFPMMEKAGLKYFAHVFSPSTFSQLAAKKSIDIMAGIVTTQYFTDLELARGWIARQPRDPA
ncbi:PAS domain S-box-containing protein [Mucilaginibacter yixingensis]|uniref:histidine kinase n=1 Tax=Mucilaginibacter yixingensis TaxID=1295612 RepID=A0A2T5JEA9_9SPHI|nr:ATP-binding protein [Mucilaginibacter yixingensis]PTR00112.1 PAS domain S-box-containing protein [Mucilaginibacter yixingensis]